MTVTGNMNVSIDGGSPWGFRLQGGGNFPLQVLKVRKRSKAQRHLVEGDIIIKVNGIPANGKTHEAVMDMVDATVGPVLNLEIYRGEALQKIPKKVMGPTPFASVAPASQKSATSSSARMSEHSQHQKTMEESMYQKKMSSQQQMTQKSTSVFQQQQQQQQQQQRLQQQQKQQQQQRLQQQHQQQQYQQQQQQQHQQQQQVTKSNIVLKNQAQQQKKVTQIQQSSQWQESSSQQQHYQQQQYQQKNQQQHMTVKQQQKAMQHQQMLREQQQLAEQQMAEQQMARKQLAEQRQHAQTQHTTSEQESIQTVEDTSSVVEQSESVQEEESTTTTTNSVSTAIWTSGQSSSLDKKQTNLVLQAYTSSPKPYKPKVAGHLPLRPCSPARPSPCPSPAPATPIPAAFDDKENWAPSPVPSKPPTPAPNVPQFNVKNVKGIVNQNWNEVELEELNLPIPDYSKKMPILPPSSREPSPPPVVKKTIEIPDMTIRPGPPVAPKPKRVLSEVQSQPLIPDHEIVPIYTEDRPHLPVFGPPVMYGLNPALAPKRSTSMGEEESIVSEASSGSRRNNQNDPKKQKIYSDSSFYYDPKGVYPTIEDQIDLCKKISQSLTAAANTKARGATMFAKRQKRSIKWIHDGYSEGNVADLEELSSELDQSEGGTKPLFQFRIPKLAQQVSVDSAPKMSLSREEFETMRTTQPKVDHTAVNPNACMSIISDLQNSKGRGAKLFAKRQARCDKWVIDDKTSSVSAPVTPSEPPSSSPSVSMMNAQNRLADMITQPMPIIQPKPKKAPLPDPPAARKNIGVPLPTVNANLQAEFKSLVEGPNFNRTARGWNAASTTPHSRAPRAQSVQPSSTKGPPPPVAPKPGKCMKHNPRPAQGMGDEQPPLHYRSSSDQLRLLSPRDPYHDASGYCSDVDHRTKVYAFKKPGMFRPKRFVAGAPMSQPVFCSDL